MEAHKTGAGQRRKKRRSEHKSKKNIHDIMRHESSRDAEFSVNPYSIEEREPP